MVTGIFRGIISYIEGFNFLIRHKLMRFFLIPGLVGGGLLILIFYILIRVLDGPVANLLTKTITWIPSDKVVDFLTNQMDWISIGLLAVLAFILFKNLLIGIMSPFMSPLSERIEDILQGEEIEKVPFSFTRIIREMIRGLRISFRNIIKEILFTILLLILGLFPLFSAISGILIFLIQAYYAGFGNLDYTLERRFSVSQSVAFVRENKGLALGNGIVFLLILLIPFLGIIIAPPLATAAGTLETLKRI